MLPERGSTFAGPRFRVLRVPVDSIGVKAPVPEHGHRGSSTLWVIEDVSRTLSERGCGPDRVGASAGELCREPYFPSIPKRRSTPPAAVEGKRPPRAGGEILRHWLHGRARITPMVVATYLTGSSALGTTIGTARTFQSVSQWAGRAAHREETDVRILRSASTPGERPTRIYRK